MRNAKFKTLQPNYRKNALEIELREGRKITKYLLPFSVFRNNKISTQNRITKISLDKELGDLAAFVELENGSKFDFPSDFVLYYCDPSYDWSPINQLKKALKKKLDLSRLSIRVLADALNTSPSQVVRLLEENKTSKQLMQLFQMAELAGYRIEFQLKKKGVA